MSLCSYKKLHSRCKFFTEIVVRVFFTVTNFFVHFFLSLIILLPISFYSIGFGFTIYFKINCFCKVVHTGLIHVKYGIFQSRFIKCVLVGGLHGCIRFFTG